MRSHWSVLAVVFAGLMPVAAHAEDVTYTKHVAPILFKHCAGCHRPGEIGPFPLLTYKDAAKRADFIKSITADKRMPPWKAEEGHGEFLDARVLSSDELKTLAAWADSGAKEGDPKDLPPLPKFTDGWTLGEPDLILKMPEPFKVPAEGRDILQCFPIPIPIDSDKMVEAFEFRPGNRKVVHHAILYLDSSGAARKKAEAEKGPGYRTFGGPGIIPSGGLGGWAPGSMPRMLPDGVARYLRKGSDLVLQVHYHPNGKEEMDQSTVGIYFSKKPVDKILGTIAMRSRDLYIKAGVKDHRVKAETEPLPCDVTALAIAPHMHYIGKEVKIDATLPDGKVVPMLWIKDWDFNWQGAYAYKSPLRLPRGTVIQMEAVYDNSKDNPRNPSDPPKDVRWGEQTTDEMCLCAIPVITDTMADLRKVASMRNGLLGMILGGGAPPDNLKDLVDPKKDEVPPGGVAIPEQFKELLGRFDKDNDGKLTAEEIDAMPDRVKERVKEYIKNRLKP